MSETLVELLDASARARPEATALLWRDSRWSYRMLREATLATAQWLAGAGVREGDRIGLLFRNCPQYVAAYYGALRLGAGIVPMNPHERAGVLARQMEHCGARIVVGDADHPEWPAVESALPVSGIAVRALAVQAGPDAAASFLAQLGSPPGVHPVPDVTPGDPERMACIIYTSGTTGQPKGVMLSHRNLVSNTLSIIEYLGLDRHDRGLVVLPFHFSYGNSVLHTHLAAGAELLLEDSLAYPHLVLQRMQDEKVTGFSGVPSTFAVLLSRCRLADYDLRSLRYLTQAGGPMPRPNISRLRDELPDVSLYIMYGQTEASARLSYLPPERLDDKLGSVGIGIPGVELAVRRLDGSRAAVGETGEIVARGPNIMMGYWRDETATRAVLADGWLHTGDLGHFDADGFLYIDGRAVEMIKVGAFRISPQEVEEVISALPGVEEIGVTSIDDDLLGQAVKAVIVVSPGARLDVRAVKAHCRAHLAAYKIPKEIEFAEVLPRTATGKIQRFRLN